MLELHPPWAMVAAAALGRTLPEVDMLAEVAMAAAEASEVTEGGEAIAATGAALAVAPAATTTVRRNLFLRTRSPTSQPEVENGAPPSSSET